MEKNKRNKIIGLSIGILVVLIIVVSSTYAYWQITRTQETPNDIVAACLNLELDDASTENTGINLDSAWPISDEEGKNLTGYTFTVTNNCNEEINYIVGLNRVEEESANYLLDSSIKLQLDDNSAFTYSDLSDVEYVDPDNTEYTARSSKQVSVETIGANETNTHTIRVWVSESAPVSEQSKTFQGQVFITGGQGIEVPECFTIADNGTILGYDESCGLDVKVPAEINGIQVKTILPMSFNQGAIGLWGNIIETGDEVSFIFLNSIYDAEIMALYKDEICEDPQNCDLKDYNITVISSVEEYNNIDWSKYEIVEYDIGDYNVNNNQIEYIPPQIESLDLNEAIYLETIGADSLNGNYTGEEPINDTCVLIEGTSRGNYYECNGSLKNVILPANGVLTTIGASAFRDNQLTEVVIPSSVTIIKDYAFYDNPLISVTIVNTEGNVTIDSSAFPSTANVTYDPNYAE